MSVKEHNFKKGGGGIFSPKRYEYMTKQNKKYYLINNISSIKAL